MCRLPTPPFSIPSTTEAQIDQISTNIDVYIRAAGGKGWPQVLRVVSYYLPIYEKGMAAMKRNYQKWMSDHRPIWTAIGVAKLGVEAMKVEIEVMVHDPETK